MDWKLKTERTRLREFTDADLEALRGLFSDPKIVRYIGGKAMAEAQVAELFSFFRSHYKKHGFGPWAVSLKGSKAVIGVAGLKLVPDLENPDLGFSYFPPYWGNGYATEIGRALLEFGFKIRRFETIGAIVNSENAATIRVLRKLGMSYQKQISRHDMDWDLYAAASPPLRPVALH